MVRKMKDNETQKRIMRKRGRPKKSPTDVMPTRKTRTIRLTDEEESYIEKKAKQCHKNFSDYCRCVLMGHNPSMPDPELREGLFAARKDIVNFTNNIRGLNMTKEDRSKLLASIPTIQIWWRALFEEIEYIKKLMERI